MTTQRFDDGELMTQAEYARRRGCTREAVRQAVEAGRITVFGDEKRVHPPLADAQWAEQSRVRAGSADSTEIPSPAPAAAQLPLIPPDGYSASRARRERAEADLREMELQERQGTLVRADAVRAELAARLGQVREALLQLPARLAPLLIVQTDQARVQSLLDTELRAVLQKLTEAP